MGLLPEFFMLLGIDIFLAMSLLSALLDDEMPQPLQYLFQGAAILGLGQLFASKSFIDSGIFGIQPTDVTRFWISSIYLAAAVSNVVGLNVYLGMVRRKLTLATAFSGTVTVPVVMTSLFFVSSFVGTGGDVSFTPATIMMLAVSAIVSGLSIFGFLRQATRRIASGIKAGVAGAAASATIGTSIAAAASSDTPGTISTTTASTASRDNSEVDLSSFSLPGTTQDEWEEAPTEEEERR